MAHSSASLENIVHLPSARAKGPIDLVHLGKQCLGDEGLEHEILRMFDTTIETHFSRLMLAISRVELSASLHTIKGASAGVGAGLIAGLAAAAERELQAGRMPTSETIADIGMAVEETRKYIARLLGESED
jgi:HPt (histidine-containing phosphotransfer) domain-containing protein